MTDTLTDRIARDLERAGIADQSIEPILILAEHLDELLDADLLERVNRLEQVLANADGGLPDGGLLEISRNRCNVDGCSWTIRVDHLDEPEANRRLTDHLRTHRPIEFTNTIARLRNKMDELVEPDFQLLDYVNQARHLADQIHGRITSHRLATQDEPVAVTVSPYVHAMIGPLVNLDEPDQPMVWRKPLLVNDALDPSEITLTEATGTQVHYSIDGEVESLANFDPELRPAITRGLKDLSDRVRRTAVDGGGGA